MTAAGRSTAAALILLFALVSALLAAFVVPAYLSWVENGQIIRENREKVAMIRSSQIAFVRVKNASDRWMLFARSPESGFLDAADPGEALDEARRHIAELLDRHGGSLVSADIVAGETIRAQIETIVIDVTATLPKTRIAPFLANLEARAPYAFISAFQMIQDTPDQVTLAFRARMQRLGEAPS